MLAEIRQHILKLEETLAAEAWPEAAQEMQQVQQLVFQLTRGTVTTTELKALENNLGGLLADVQQRRTAVDRLLQGLATSAASVQSDEPVLPSPG